MRPYVGGMLVEVFDGWGEGMGRFRCRACMRTQA